MTTQANHYDLIVIGAGINGAGIARDAAMRGLKVCLLDKGDIGSGSSSASTRLIHGGLRYLEHWEFSLVRESLRERETLLRIAHHLVRPLPLLIPIYNKARRGALQIRAGMLLYDLFSFDKTLPRHRMLSRAEALTHAPALNPEGLIAAALYYDAQVEFAERLVLENVLSAWNQGADVFTYAQVTRLLVEHEIATGVELAVNGERRNVRGGFIINAAGPWVDELLKTNNTPRLIGATKGSHIVVAPFPQSPASAIYAEAHSNGRPFFIIPWNGNYLIGTTDIRFDGDPDKVCSDEQEIEYLLTETNRVLPHAQLGKNDVLYSYSGLRPLPYTDVADEQKITRRHFIRQHGQLNNLVSVVGGKLTTYRSLAEECVDLTFKKLARTSPKCETGLIPLPGAEDFSKFAFDFRSNSPFSDNVNERLLRIYGSRASDVVEVSRRSPDLSRPLNSCPTVLASEIVFAFEEELAQTLTDCLMRRTMAGFNSDLALGMAEECVEICGRFLGWTNERTRREVDEYRYYVNTMQLPRP